jgi:DNA-binding NtrC family response regulator
MNINQFITQKELQRQITNGSVLKLIGYDSIDLLVLAYPFLNESNNWRYLQLPVNPKSIPSLNEYLFIGTNKQDEGDKHAQIKGFANHTELSRKQFEQIVAVLGLFSNVQILFADDKLPEKIAHPPNVTIARTPDDAIKILRSDARIKLAVIDIKFNNSVKTGFDILTYLPNGAKSIMLTGFDGFGECLNAWQKGADFFISKYQFTMEHFKAIVQLIQMDDAPLLIGKSQAMQSLWKRIAFYSGLKQDILISGENGTGKELVAKAIYSLSIKNQSVNPYVAVNCSALHENLFESILYGHKKGSFTGAITDQIGYMEIVKGGILFLDEVSELPEAQQAKLLRTLQEKEFNVLGKTKPERFKGRLLYGTNRDLDKLVQEKRFRQDLYYRVLGMEIKVPPLREHKEDIEMLAAYFAFRFIKQNEITDPPDYSISEIELNKLKSYQYPGNIRELEKIVTKACAEALLAKSKDLFFDLPEASEVADNAGKGVSNPGKLDMLCELLSSKMISSRGLSDATKLNLIAHLKNQSYTLRQIADLMVVNEQSLRNLKSKHKQ